MAESRSPDPQESGVSPPARASDVEPGSSPWGHGIRLPSVPWAVVFVLVCLTLLLNRDFVFWGRAFFERDVQTHWFSQAVAFFAAIVKGDWPVWNPNASFGEPIWAYPTQVLYPTTWLLMLMPPWLVYTTTVILHLLFSGLGFYALARRCEASREGALAGACAWLACGPLLSTANMINNIIGAAWLPWMALAANTALGSGRAFHACLWGATLAAPVLAGSEAAFMGGLLTAADTLRRVAWREPFGQVNRGLARTAGTALFFALSLSAAQWLPTLELTGRTSRQALPRDVRTDSSLDVLSLVQVALPLRLENLPFNDHGTGGVLDTQTFLRSLHLGTPLLALALAAFASKRRKHTWFYAGAVVLAGAFALGRYGPFYDPLTFAIPLLRAIRYPVKAMLLVSLGVCLLAAIGFDGWREPGKDRGRWRRFVVWPTAALALLALLVPTTLLLNGEDLARRALFLPAGSPSPAELLGPRFPSLIVGGVVAFLVFALAAMAGRVPRNRGGGAPRVLVLRSAQVLAVLAVAELAAFHWNINASAPRELYRYCPPSAAAVGPPQDARLYSRTMLTPTGWRWPPPGMSTEIATALAVRDYLVPQVAAVCGFRGSYERDAKGIEPPYLGEMTRLLEASLGTPTYLRLLQVGGVTHVASLDLAGLESLRPVAKHQTPFGDMVHLLAVPRALPRTFVADGVRIATGSNALAALVDQGFDPAREVVLEGGVAKPPGPSPPGSSRIGSSRTDRVLIHAELDRPGYVVLLDAFDVWWRASVDGVETPVERADVAFRAVRVGPGKHEIVFRYESPPIRLGLIWTLLAAALAMAVGLHHAWRSRRAVNDLPAT